MFERATSCTLKNEQCEFLKCENTNNYLSFLQTKNSEKNSEKWRKVSEERAKHSITEWTDIGFANERFFGDVRRRKADGQGKAWR